MLAHLLHSKILNQPEKGKKGLKKFLKRVQEAQGFASEEEKRFILGNEFMLLSSKNQTKALKKVIKEFDKKHPDLDMSSFIIPVSNEILIGHSLAPHDLEIKFIKEVLVQKQNLNRAEEKLRIIKNLPEKFYDEDLKQSVLIFLNNKKIEIMSHAGKRGSIEVIPGELHQLIGLVHDLPHQLIEGAILEFSKDILRQMLIEPTRSRAYYAVAFGVIKFPEPYRAEFGKTIDKVVKIHKIEISN